MKKVIIILFFVFSVVLLSGNSLKVDASEGIQGTFYGNSRSPYYDKNLVPENSTHLGFSYTIHYPNNSTVLRYALYEDIFIDNQYRIKYAGVLGSLQPSFYNSMMELDQTSISKMSFFITQEYVESDSFQMSLVTEVNDIQSGIGVMWSETTRYASGVKISTNVSNDYNAPYIIMVLYQVDALVYGVSYRGVSEKTSGTWTSFDFSGHTKTTNSRYITIGYVAHYAFVGGDNDQNYETGQYLIDNNSFYNNSDMFYSGD